MKGLDYLRMSFGNVDAKLPTLKEVKPQHPLGKFSDYEDALDELCVNALAKLTPEQREIIFRRCSRNIRSWEKMKHLHAFFGVGGFHRFYIKDYVGGAAMLLTGGGLLIWWIIDRFKMKKKLQEYNSNIVIQALDDKGYI